MLSKVGEKPGMYFNRSKGRISKRLLTSLGAIWWEQTIIYWIFQLRGHWWPLPEDFQWSIEMNSSLQWVNGSTGNQYIKTAKIDL